MARAPYRTKKRGGWKRLRKPLIKAKSKSKIWRRWSYFMLNRRSPTMPRFSRSYSGWYFHLDR